MQTVVVTLECTTAEPNLPLQGLISSRQRSAAHPLFGYQAHSPRSHLDARVSNRYRCFYSPHDNGVKSATRVSSYEELPAGHPLSSYHRFGLVRHLGRERGTDISLQHSSAAQGKGQGKQPPNYHCHGLKSPRKVSATRL